jgi:two-component sensor histidine kinase
MNDLDAHEASQPQLPENGAVETRIRDLELALERQATLLRESDHRMKNNLQLISSLILLQSRRTEAGAAREALRTMLDRVNAIAAVHRRMFREGGVEQFDLTPFIRDLAADLAASAGRDDLQFRLDLEPVHVAAAQAAPLALVANELLGNALKHAYPPNTAGAVDVLLRRSAEGLELTIADVGVGRRGAPRGFGLTITQMLTQQLHAQLNLKDTQPGLRATVTLAGKTAAAP